jgi:hypothetical protein
MADDNRLLQVMLEEEMGVSFETLDHPVVIGFMATLGTLVSLALLNSLSYLPYGVIIGSLSVMILTSIYESKKQKLPSFQNLIWGIASLLFVFTIAYFINQFVT